MRMIFPSFIGLRPRSDALMAFSMSPIEPLSNGVTTMQPRLRSIDRGELIQVRLGAVVVDRDPVEKAGLCAAGADLRELLAHRGLRAFDLPLGVAQDFLDHGAPPRTTVPIGCPPTARLRLPSTSMSKTSTGMSLSMQSEMAVESMILSFWLKTSK